FETTDHAVYSILEVLHIDGFLVASGGNQCRFVTNVGDFGTRKAGCLGRKLLGVDLGSQFQWLQVHLEDLLPPHQVGFIDGNLPVEPSGTEQSRVQHVRPVGSRHDDNARVGTETVHFYQQLVQCILTLVITPHHAVFAPRSEEHTSELQSRENLVCRLLLEKKKPHSPP